MKRSIVVVLAIGIAAALGYLAQRQLQVGATVPATVATAVTTAAPPAAAEAKPAEATIPETLPQFELADRDGKKHTLGEWKGRPLMVNYWASWCGPVAARFRC